MQHCPTMECGSIHAGAVAPKAAPLFARLMSKLVLEVLPASLASVIGAALLAHYQFGHPSAAAGADVMVAAVPASPEMLQLVRDEHDLIRDLIVAQQAAQATRYAKADVADAAPSSRDAADAALVAAALRRTANATPTKTAAPRMKVAAAATAPAPQAAPPAPAPAVAAPAAPEPPAMHALQNSAVPPAADAPPAHRSLVAKLLSVKDHVVGAPLHAVMTIGGIPSWIGHRLGSDEPDQTERMLSAAS